MHLHFGECNIVTVHVFLITEVDLCYNIVVLHVLSKILQNTCQRKISILSTRPFKSNQVAKGLHLFFLFINNPFEPGTENCLILRLH